MTAAAVLERPIQFGAVELDAIAVGSQGNAVLGIRDSGKTYTATLLAEGLFEAGIPFIAFDPIGVWRFLRVPGAGRGYPVVVAGGVDGDLPLAPETVPALVEAAMKNGVSLVLDLFDVNLSKADWRRIVTEALRTLLHKNSQYGLRHVFIEEASEFCPQRPNIDSAKVYSEVEKLARMGGNCRLGFTLINQRSEEVSKAVLELCDNLFLHRQKGRNSLTALSKWLDVGNVAAGKQIISTLSTLPSGQCWAWLQGSDVPVLTQVPTKNSMHPDRRVMRDPAGAPHIAAKAVGVDEFVTAMKAALALPPPRPSSDEHALRAEFERGLRVGESNGEARGMAKMRRIMQHRFGEFLDFLDEDVAEDPPAPARQVEPPPEPEAAETPAPAFREPGALPKSQLHLLGTLAAAHAIFGPKIDKTSLAFLAGVSHKSGTYFANLSALRGAGLITYPGDGFVAITEAGRAVAPSVTVPATNDAVQRAVLAKLTRPQQAIVEALLSDHPKPLTKDQAAERAGASPTSGAYFGNLARLRGLGIIDYPTQGSLSVTELLFPYGLGHR